MRDAFGVSKRDTTKRHNEAITSAQGGVATMGAGAAGGAFLIGEGQRQRAKEFKGESRRTWNKAHKTIQAANDTYAENRKRITQAVVTDYRRGHDPKMLKIQGKYLHDRAKVARDFGNKRGFMLADDSERAAKAAKTAIARGKTANKVALGIGGASLAGVAALQTRRKKEKVVKDAFGVERIEKGLNPFKNAKQAKQVEQGLEMASKAKPWKPPGDFERSARSQKYRRTSRIRDARFKGTLKAIREGRQPSRVEAQGKYNTRKFDSSPFLRPESRGPKPYDVP
jgi:hypothetical protein